MLIKGIFGWVDKLGLKLYAGFVPSEKIKTDIFIRIRKTWKLKEESRQGVLFEGQRVEEIAMHGFDHKSQIFVSLWIGEEVIVKLTDSNCILQWGKGKVARMHLTIGWLIEYRIFSGCTKVC